MTRETLSSGNGFVKVQVQVTRIFDTEAVAFILGFERGIYVFGSSINYK